MGKKPVAGVLGLCLGLSLTGCASDNNKIGANNWNTRPGTATAQGTGMRTGTSGDAAWRTPAAGSSTAATGGMGANGTGSTGGFDRMPANTAATGGSASGMVTPSRMDSGMQPSGNGYPTGASSTSPMTGSGDRGVSRTDVNYVPSNPGTSSLPTTPKSTMSDPAHAQSDLPSASELPVARTGSSTVAPIHDVSSHSSPATNDLPLPPPQPPGPPAAASSALPLPPIGGTGPATEMPSPPPAAPTANDPPPLPPNISSSPTKGSSLSIPTPPPGVQK